MGKFEDLNGRYSGLQIQQILNILDDRRKNWQESRKAAIELLYWLEQTNRYRDDARYAKSTFRQFLEYHCGMTYQEYFEARLACIAFPEQTERYGYGTIKKAKRLAGIKNLGKVIKKLDRAAESHDGVLTREQIADTLAPLKKKKKAAKSGLQDQKDYEALYKQEKRINVQLMNENAELRKAVNELEERNARLRARLLEIDPDLRDGTFIPAGEEWRREDAPSMAG